MDRYGSETILEVDEEQYSSMFVRVYDLSFLHNRSEMESIIFNDDCFESFRFDILMPFTLSSEFSSSINEVEREGRLSGRQYIIYYDEPVFDSTTFEINLESASADPIQYLVFNGEGLNAIDPTANYTFRRTFNAAHHNYTVLTLDVRTRYHQYDIGLNFRVEERGFLPFVRGDVNGNWVVNITDAIYLLQWLYSGQGILSCVDAADINDDGILNITDPIFLLDRLFLNQSESEEESWSFGYDETGDDLRCNVSPQG